MLDIASLHPLPAFQLGQGIRSDAHRQYSQYYGLDFESQGLCENHDFGGLKLGGYWIAAHYFRCPQARGTVVINHGYLDHSGLYNKLVKVFLSANYDVLIYDLPGHGLSSGALASIDSFAEYQTVLSQLLQQLDDTLTGPRIILGQSTGGAIAMDYVLNVRHHGFERMILLAPLVMPLGWRMIKMQLRVMGHLLQSVPRAFKSNTHDKDFSFFQKHDDVFQAQRIPLRWLMSLEQWIPHFMDSQSSILPTFVVQGDADTTVAWETNIPIIEKKFRQAQLLILPGARHQLANEAIKYRERIAQAMLAFVEEAR